MRKIIVLSALFASSVFAADLNITVDNIQSNKGNIRIVMFAADNAAQFPDGKGTLVMDKATGKQVAGVVIPAKLGSISFTVSAPAGIYAVAAFQDEDNNKSLNKVFLLGIPLEPYGFSNDARKSFSAPDFSQAQFELPASGATIAFDVMGYYAD